MGVWAGVWCAGVEIIIVIGIIIVIIFRIEV